MKIDSRDKQNINMSKYLLIGFIIGIIPFIVIILISSNISGSIDNIPKIFKNTIIIFGIVISLINAFIFKNMMSNKLKEFSNWKLFFILIFYLNKNFCRWFFSSSIFASIVSAACFLIPALINFTNYIIFSI